MSLVPLAPFLDFARNENLTRPRLAIYATRPQQFLYFFPLPQGHGSLRPTFGISRRTGASSSFTSAPSPSPFAAIPPPIRSGRRPGNGPFAVAVGAVGACSRRRNCG